MRKISTILVILLCAIARAADDQKITHWEFDWKLVDQKDFSLSIIKTQDNTSVRLEGGTLGYIRMTPKEAEAVGKALQQAEAMHAKLKGEHDAESTLEAGSFIVMFNFDVKYGFSIHVKPKERFAIQAVRMDEVQAKEVAGFMVQAVSLAATVDKRVNPSEAPAVPPVPPVAARPGTSPLTTGTGAKVATAPK